MSQKWAGPELNSIPSGGEEFQTGISASGVAVTTDCRLLSRIFPRYFRRQGAESDLTLSVVDTPPVLPSPQNVHRLCPAGVHVVVLVVRADLPQSSVHVEEQAEAVFGPLWRRHALLVLTHADRLKEAGLDQSRYMTQASDWLSALSRAVGGGVFFLDNSRDWPSVRGRPLRDGVLRLSARNHHEALTLTADAML
ncbi:uncharacterized protein V6R79_021133 [Siganus canaliculatus]